MFAIIDNIILHLFAKLTNETYARKMGDFHEIGNAMNAKDLAKQEGVTVRAINTRWNAKFPGETFNSNAALSPVQIAELREAGKRRSRVKPKNIVVVRSKPKEEKPGGGEAAGPLSGPAPSTAEGPKGWQKFLLVLLLLAPTAASVNNMLHITEALAGNYFDAVLLTVVLSASALGLVLAGVRDRWTLLLAVVLIAFESFCNLTRIYGGLMGVGTTGNPTRFLGLVTDIFNTGSHGTAIALGCFTALFIAAVQYAAVFQLNQK